MFCKQNEKNKKKNSSKRNDSSKDTEVAGRIDTSIHINQYEHIITRTSTMTTITNVIVGVYIL